MRKKKKSERRLEGQTYPLQKLRMCHYVGFFFIIYFSNKCLYFALLGKPALIFSNTWDRERVILRTEKKKYVQRWAPPLPSTPTTDPRPKNKRNKQRQEEEKSWG